MSKLAVFVMLLAGMGQCATGQWVAEGYRGFTCEGKRLIIAPLLSIDSVDISLLAHFNDVPNPKDSVAALMDRELQHNLRKFTHFYSLYSSTFAAPPNLERRTLSLGQHDTLGFLLPRDGESVRLQLFGRQKVNPDFVLFISIGRILYASSSELDPGASIAGTIISSAIQPGLVTLAERNVEGMFMENFRFVFWDNNTGRIAAYNRGNLFCQFDDDAPFRGHAASLDLMARFILTKTPFSDPDMAYYRGY